ncbi:phosphotyrosine-specific ptp2-like protein [Diplodia corticola]|uniref:protein-tyrosine-phosphatase n=1 Tax=Diplodia corticola TaxID=236234 RepID=A0A1J9SJN0_9PEZI|nr:phosphotyrosine-specific ptp2-like protein [Diplodia corticola]OJD39964.1 phosphotyrosine-specific ptp2-like protein [Diplodia corticola]
MTTSAATPSHTPCAWEHHPHSQQRPASSRATTARTPASVGQPLPPALRPNDTRSPIAQDARTPSPNYFGLAFDSTADIFSSSGARHAKANWSPPNSNVRSAAAASPRVIPVDQNPEFEAFRRQSEEGRKFSLGGGLSQFTFAKSPMSLSNPPSARSTSHVDSPTTHQNVTPVSPRSSDSSGSFLIPEKPRSPKRMLSSDASGFPARPRRLSPGAYPDSSDSDQPPKFADPAIDRLSMLPSKMSANASTHTRAETLPANLDIESAVPKQGPVMVTPQHVVTLLESSEEEILLLDLRVSTQYALFRIRDALNLCIPTTLLKRVSFNVEKLAETFSLESQRKKFENWRSCRYIVVYDADSSQLKDATSCVNTLKKFANEGWNGPSYIIRGGIKEFATKFPTFVTKGAGPSASSASQKPSLKLDDMPGPAPVVGGCPMPATQNAANPFFGNIRQNMDLIGGVGQMPVKRPQRINTNTERQLPGWLKHAADEKDKGASVSDKFLQIEKREQKRMQEALSGKVVYGEPGPEAPKSVKIAGIEKGTKNRYNNIWPFEHSRVKLEGVPSEGCDYFNANYVQPPWSNKRYIATQGPIPVTFADFWSVVWQQDVRVIVMLTAEKEGGQIKAHNYWDGQQYGAYRLNFHTEHRASLEPGAIRRHHARGTDDRSSEVLGGSSRGSGASSQSMDYFPSPDPQTSSSSDQPYVIVRKFTLSNTELPFARMREITQLQYSNWPDFGAPAHPAHLLGLVEQCDAVVRQTQSGSADEPDPLSSHPVLVHCSAGCGRTGTFCTVDSVIDMLKRQRSSRSRRQASPMDVDKSSTTKGKDNPFFKSGDATTDEGLDGAWLGRDDIDLIEKTVETFRHQRLSMVQSLRQFVLCYESVLEWLVEQHQDLR